MFHFTLGAEMAVLRFAFQFRSRRYEPNETLGIRSGQGYLSTGISRCAWHTVINISLAWPWVIRPSLTGRSVTAS